MTLMNHPLPLHETTSRTGSPRAPRSAARRPHAVDFSDAVVAAYIREISTRHRPPHAAAQPDDRGVRATQAADLSGRRFRTRDYDAA
jgi:hypothetical protein